MTFTEVQLGKNGITENFIETLKNRFQRYENVRISVLKSAGHESKKQEIFSRTDSPVISRREKVRKYSDEILEKLGKNYTSRIIGFKIVLKKWKKAKR